MSWAILGLCPLPSYLLWPAMGKLKTTHFLSVFLSLRFDKSLLSCTRIRTSRTLLEKWNMITMSLPRILWNMNIRKFPGILEYEHQGILEYDLGTLRSPSKHWIGTSQGQSCGYENAVISGYCIVSGYSFFTSCWCKKICSIAMMFKCALVLSCEDLQTFVFKHRQKHTHWVIFSKSY